MSERAALLVVRFRWLIVALWAVIGTAGLIRAPGTAELLSVRGGADRETEAAQADRLLTSRFARPFSEFFAVVIESPAPFTDGLPAAMLDSITDELKHEPFVRSILSYRTAHDSLFLSADGRMTFLLVSVDAPRATAWEKWSSPSGGRWAVPSAGCPIATPIAPG